MKYRIIKRDGRYYPTASTYEGSSVYSCFRHKLFYWRTVRFRSARRAKKFIKRYHDSRIETVVEEIKL